MPAALISARSAYRVCIANISQPQDISRTEGAYRVRQRRTQRNRPLCSLVIMHRHSVSIGYGIKPAVIGIVKIGYKVAVADRYRGAVAVNVVTEAVGVV